MTQHPTHAIQTARRRTSRVGLEALGGGVAVAAALVVLARWLPLSFSYHANTLGIVSATTRTGHPSQQEPILYVLFGTLGLLAGWAAAATLARRAPTLRQLLALEALAVAALASALGLPRAAGTTAAAALLVGFGGLAARSAHAEPQPRAASDADAQPGPTRSGVTAGLVGAILGLAALRVPRCFEGLWAVVSRIPDEHLTRNDWVFQAEDGQHLAWADALAQGLLHGRDFFCIYGPLYDWSVVGVWKLVGRSLAGWHLHVGLSELLAWVAFLSLAATMLRRRWLLLPLIVLTPHLSLRIGLPLAALVFLVRFARARRTRDVGLAGLLTGVALLYSQEFGLAALLAALLVQAVDRSPRALAAWAVGLALAMMPTLLAYGAAGALGPMLDDLAGYPAAVAAGYGNLPFPSLRASLPWPLAIDPVGTRFLRMAYALAAIPVLALAISLPRTPVRPRKPLRWIRQLLDEWAARPEALAVAILALFGLIAYRTALGRSDEFHLFSCTPTAFLLVLLGLDRLLDRLGEARPAVVAQLAFGALLLLASGLPTGAGGAGWFHLRSSFQAIGRIASSETDPRGHGGVNRIVAWLEAHSLPQDRFYFLPNDAAFYYLTGRPATTRWVVSHQMVTDAHRAEALADLQAAPPRYVVWNDATLRVDGIPDEVVLGPALWRWLHANYGLVERVGGARIWEHGVAGSAADEANGR
jgi:hypothetical protein